MRYAGDSEGLPTKGTICLAYSVGVLRRVGTRIGRWEAPWLCRILWPCLSFSRAFLVVHLVVQGYPALSIEPVPNEKSFPQTPPNRASFRLILADFGGSDQQKAPGAGFLVFPITVCRVGCRKPDFGGYPFLILLFLRFQKTEKHNFRLLYFFWSPFNLEQKYHIPLPRKLVDFI